MVSLTFAIGTPSFCALTRSISTNSCGVLAVKGENTCVSPGALRAAALAILDAHRETAAGADTRHRRRRNDDDECPLNRRQALAQIGSDCRRGEPLLQAHFRLLEHREQSRSIADRKSTR